MSHFLFQIATKSLYYGINNDNKIGHTATVSTNLKQQGTIKPELDFFKSSSSNIDFSKCPLLVDECIKNSKSECRITNILVFDHIFVNGTKVECDSSFCLYLKEEIDKEKIQFGRIKLHYPIGLQYEDFLYSISNRKVLTAIQDTLHGYAFIVRELEIIDKGSLNFVASIVGQSGIAYSKVFLNYRGDSGKKFTKVFNEEADDYDFEIFTIRDHKIPGIDYVGPNNYSEVYNYEKKIAKDECYRKLTQLYSGEEIYRFSDEYPYSIYDFEIRSSTKVNYVMVAFTSTNISYFYLSNIRSEFISSFSGNSSVFLIKNVLSSKKDIEIYTDKEIKSMSRSITMLKYRR